MSSFEPLDEKMEAGYMYVMSKNIVEGTSIWNEAWKIFITLVDEKGIKTLEEFDKIFNGKKYVTNWVPDFELLLKEATEIEFNYHKLIIKICGEYLKRFDDGSSSLTNLNFRKTFCDSMFALGEDAKSEEYFMMWLKKEPGWTGGWMTWAECWLKYTESTKKDLKKAASILNMALEQKNQTGGKTVIYEKLIFIYEKLKDKNKVDKMKALKKDIWGLEGTGTFE